MGVEYAKRRQSWELVGMVNLHKWMSNFEKNWPTLLVQDFIPMSIILKWYFIWIKFGAAQAGCVFEVQGHCAAPDWGCRKNRWLISYLWTKICWKQFWAGQLFWIDDPYCSEYWYWYRSRIFSLSIGIGIEIKQSIGAKNMYQHMVMWGIGIVWKNITFC